METTRFTLLTTVHLFLLHDDQILLLRRYNTGYADGQYSVVAGHLDGNEEIKAAMIREANEEAGIVITREDIQIVGVMHRKDIHEIIDFFLLATSWSGEIVNNEPDKCDQLTWFPLNNLPDNTAPYIRRAIRNYRQGKWFDSFGWS